jgi:hypothetical protein
MPDKEKEETTPVVDVLSVSQERVAEEPVSEQNKRADDVPMTKEEFGAGVLAAGVRPLQELALSSLTKAVSALKGLLESLDEDDKKKSRD